MISAAPTATHFQIITKKTQRAIFPFNAIWLIVNLFVSTAIAGTTMNPVAVTGFNSDLVIENTASGPPYNSYAVEFNPGEGTAFYQSGLAGKSYGLPASGSLISALGDGTIFSFQPYTGNNALVLSSATGLTSGNLTLLAPNTFSRIAILANSGSATSNSVGTLTLHFSDGSTFVTNYNAQDWFFNPGFALQAVDRININNGATDGGPNNEPRFYQTTIDLATALGTNNMPLASLTFGKASSANSTAIYAVSGLPASPITLPAVTNVPAINIQTKTAVIGGQITSTGGEAPAVTIFYGATDGGTNASQWAQNIALGLQGGSFTQTVSGLTPNGSYYYTSRAVNSAGTNWAMPSAAFQTPPLTLPALTTQSAGNVQGTFATLNGQILSTGGETPTVTIFYGTTDGGTTPGAWAKSIILGQQTADFAQTVTGLSPNTLYYYTANAMNSMGTTWAAPSQTFTTRATNSPSPFVAVLTQHNDGGRTGMNLNETFLNITNVNTNQFGLLFSRNVDDQIYAQPLVMTNVNILGRGTHNIAIIATVNDSVYAFDADNASVTAPYWTVSFIHPPNIVAPANKDLSAIGACGGNYQDFSGNMGIVGTPVIDPVAGTVYLVARTKENGTTFVQRLHALDVATGAERPNSPVIISATYAGTGDGNVGGVMSFDPLRENQRPGLALANGTVYIGWASHCDSGPYHGWIIGYDQTTLQRVAVYNDTPNGYNGGIWMSGQAPACDANGNLYVAVGNGTVDINGGPNRGESFLKLARSGTNLTVASWFTPYNWQALENGDIDLGSGGLLLIPGTTLAISGGKEGIVYLVNRDSMGGLTSSTTTNDNIIQSFPITTDEVHGGAVWWDGPGISYGYFWPSSTNLQQFVFNRGSGKFTLPTIAQSSTAAPSGQPGGILAVSGNGTNAGTAILWAVHQLGGDANQQVLPGILHAYSAQNVGIELWNSEQFSARDTAGKFAKFVPPTVANGKVYLATFANRLNVYGLQPPPPVGISLSGGTTFITWPTNTPASYILQTSTNLVSGIWLDVTNRVSLTNGVYQVTLPETMSETYYRLKL
ncbi:MAG: C-terminal target protein [Pedosphaera sp.]|nr:C-terminal target protein [Pedosphaera sp.]